MTKSLYFYDLETTGFNAARARIMQFAGQRTELNLKQIGEPQNILIKLSPDILPDPGAILITGITPQQTINEGISEVDFLRLFHDEIVTKETIFVGFNSVRFDDEFMRYIHYRNFYDPYEWQWRDGRAKWDLLDVIRMMRALRPEGINWPEVDNKPTNRLELLTEANKISHEGAHDALSDVIALIDLARLVMDKQPKLFDFLLNMMTNKNKINSLINENDAFVYTSGKYSGDFEKTTVVGKLIDHPKRQGVLVFDLRFDPNDYADLSVDELVTAWRPTDPDQPRLPIKALMFNRCPAIAPISVLDEESQKRIKLSKKGINENYSKLQIIKPSFSKKIIEALDTLDKSQEQKYSQQETGVDAQLYNGFFSEKDRQLMSILRDTNPSELSSLSIKFGDKRLNKLLPLYKARNYPKTLAPEETQEWEKYRSKQLLSGGENSLISNYFKQLNELSNDPKLDNNKRFLIEEMKIYGESIIPSSDF